MWRRDKLYYSDVSLLNVSRQTVKCSTDLFSSSYLHFASKNLISFHCSNEWMSLSSWHSDRKQTLLTMCVSEWINVWLAGGTISHLSSRHIFYIRGDYIKKIVNKPPVVRMSLWRTRSKTFVFRAKTAQNEKTVTSFEAWRMDRRWAGHVTRLLTLTPLDEAALCELLLLVSKT